jgi:hypothetical protein
LNLPGRQVVSAVAAGGDAAKPYSRSVTCGKAAAVGGSGLSGERTAETREVAPPGRGEWLYRPATSRFPSGFKVVVVAFVASRLALLIVGLMSLVYLQPLTSHVNPVHLSGNPALAVWGAWDSGWLVSLAEHGYATHPGPDGQVNWVYFPAYPLISAVLAHLLHQPVFVVMLGVSNAAFFGALLLAHRFASLEFNRRTGDLTVVLLCAVPGSYIFSSAYTESLFLFAVTGSLLLLQNRRWLAAGVVAGLAALTRNLGIGLTLPLLVMAAPELISLARRIPAEGATPRRQLINDGLRVAVGLALPGIALLTFCAYLYHKSGDPLAFVTAQKAWGRQIGNPLATPLLNLLQPSKIMDANMVSFVFSWLSLGLVVSLAIMRRWALFILAAFMTLVPLSTGLDTYARYCLVVLPLYLAAARLLAPRSGVALSTVVVLATINGFMMVAWTFGLPVTT